MSTSKMLVLTVILAACGTDRALQDPTSPVLLALDESAAPTDVACLTDLNACPPDAWVFSPEDLVPEFPQSSSNCDFVMFGLPPTIPQWDFHPTAACRERQWGSSGIYRQEARDIHVTNLPLRCGGPGDIDEIRLCSLAWKNLPTPYGAAGSAGCVVVKLEVTCGV
jgi:hypothetical protein